MDIRQLQRFVTVAEAGSFNKASEFLAISQPSLTRSIQLLEELLDTKLFERGPRGIVLTLSGKKLLPYARIILNERDRAVSAIDGLRNTGAETISIGADTAFCSRRLPQALTRFVDTHPHIRIHVVENDVGEMLDHVRDGRLDMVLGPRAPYLDLDGLNFEPLSTEGASVLLRSAHPLAAQKALTLEDLLPARWIVSGRPVIRDGWTQMFVRAKLPIPPVAFFTSSLRLTKACLLHDDFVSVGNHASYAWEMEQGLLRRIDIGPDTYRRPTGVFRRIGTRASKVEKQFVEVLRHVCREETFDVPASQSNSFSV